MFVSKDKAYPSGEITEVHIRALWVCLELSRVDSIWCNNPSVGSLPCLQILELAGSSCCVCGKNTLAYSAVASSIKKKRCVNVASRN